MFDWTSCRNLYVVLLAGLTLPEGKVHSCLWALFLLFETERTGAVIVMIIFQHVDFERHQNLVRRMAAIPATLSYNSEVDSVKMTSWHTSEGFCFRDNQNGGNLHGQHLHVSFWGFSDQDTSFEHGKVVPKGAATLVRRKCHCTCDRIQWLFNVLAKMGEMLKWQRNTMKYEETGSWYVIVSFRDLFRWKWVIPSCGFCGCRFDLFRHREHKLLWLTMRITRGVKICKSRRAFDWATGQHDPYTSSTYIDMPYMPTISGLARRKASWGIFGCSWLWLQFGAQSDLNAGWTQDGIWLWLFLIFGIAKVTRWITTHDHLCWSHSKNPTKKSRVILSFQPKNRSAPFLDLKLIDQTYPLTYIHHHQGMGSMVQIPGALVCMSTQFFVPQFISISTSVIWSHWWQHFDGYIASWSILPMLKSQVVTKSPLQIVKINHYLYHHMSW